MIHRALLLFGLWSSFPDVYAHRGENQATQPNLRKWVEPGLMPDDTAGASFFEDFAGNWPTRWRGDVASFDTASGGLGLVEQAAAPATISIPSPRLRNTLWEAGVRIYGAFSTSSHIRLYLATTNGSPDQPQIGYHLQLDGTDDSHVYRLWRQNGRTRSLVFESAPIANQTDGFRARIRVTCTAAGRWQVLAEEYDKGYFEVIPDKEGNPAIVDDTYLTGGYSGYFVNFSPKRWNDFKLDYFLIKPLDPALPPDPKGLPQPGDILINEMLTNPRPNGVDFVELYNYSSTAVNLSLLDIAGISSGGVVGSRRKITEYPIFLSPNGYSVLTSKPDVIKQHYPKSDAHTFIEMPALPNFNNETGGVVLYRDSLVIDSLFYTPAMQSPFVVDHSGVSLERQHFSDPTHAPENFRSAAIAIGGATPGYQNSRHPAEAAQEELFLTSNTISPDHDGFEDYLEINYRFGESGLMANIDIYTDEGRLVKRLQRNQSLATEGMVTWDGLADNNQRLPLGIYVAVIEIYSANGHQKIYRKSFVLAARL